YTPLMKTVEMTRTQPANVTLTASDIATATANLPALESIARTCEANGVQLLLVLTPTAPPGLNTWRLELARKQLRPRHPGLRTLDLSAPGAVPGLDFKTDFFDPGHPTYVGAAKVSARLGEYLARTYGIRDHRGDPAYAQWERDAVAHDETLRKKGAKRVYGQSAETSRAATGTVR
ncbi:MAG: hypothetical protein Q7V62_17800, partial [Actinomycetota bacterium]|nr:hypothetical protein [Actinomycetota bacterium]